MAEQSRRAAVITPYFVDRDAVCNDVFHSAQALRRAGIDARVFAVSGQSEREPALPIEELASFLRSPDDIAYYHFSTGKREITDVLEHLACRKVLKFHNITPPELFSMWSDELAEASRVGRAEMAHIGKMRWERVFADSAFNLAELRPWLAQETPCEVLPPFHETGELFALKPAASQAKGPPRLMTVGRIVQSKGHPFLLRVMRYLVQELDTPAILDIVGKPDHRLMAYLRMLELMVSEWQLDRHVRFHGELPAQALAARYAEASVFLSASEHEGFCVPIVEAMAFGVPVVALGTTAVPETVGGAGIVWEERDARRFAVTIQRLLAAPDERRWLATQGLERFRGTFDAAAIERRLLHGLALA